MDAEAIKVAHGSAWSDLIDKENTIQVPSVGGRPARALKRKTLAEVIEPRYVELLTMINDEINRIQTDLSRRGVKHQLAAGVVLTGGAQIDGIVECAQKIFNCQVRVGAPSGVQGLTDYVVKPAYSTGVGY